MTIFGKTRHWLIAGLCAALALGVGAPTAPAVVPGANGKIAFASVRDGNYEVYVMNADGTGQTNVTGNPADDLDPAWSPDGTKIAFTSLRDGDYEAYVMNADGSGQTNLTSNPADDEDPAWSPDGTRIAFTSFRDGDYEVYVMNADGSGQTNLTNSPSRDAGPAWSPDGTKIAFLSDRDGNFEVYVMNADGSAPTNRTSNPSLDGSPAWSPDGTKIAFRSTRDGNDEVYVMNADGSAPTNLTGNPGLDLDPAWSPDGTKIAFRSHRDGNAEVYVMNADGSAPTNLTGNPGNDLVPDWQTIPSNQFPDQGDNLIAEIGALQLTGQADVRRDSAQQFCVNGFNRARWASNGMPKTNDDGRAALLQVRQCVLYLMGPPAQVQTASAQIRLALIELVCQVAHLRYDEVNAAGGANASRLVQAKTSLDQADAAPGTNGALYDCVNAWSVLRNEPPQYTS